MSIKLISELYEERSIDAKLQRVLVCLCDNANDDGVCWPSVGRIAWKLECGESTVQRAIRQLKSMGVVTVIPREGHSNVYRIDLSVLPPKAPYEPPKGEPWHPGQNDTPPQNGYHRGVQNDTPTPPQNDTQNRKVNRQVEPSINRRTPKKDDDRLRQEFESFWSHYPRKTDKDDAWRAWKKLDPSPQLQTTIGVALAQQIANNWHGKDKQFIPHGSTWLNKKRWEDEILVPENGAPTPIHGQQQQMDTGLITFPDGTTDHCPKELYGTERTDWFRRRWAEWQRTNTQGDDE